MIFYRKPRCKICKKKIKDLDKEIRQEITPDFILCYHKKCMTEEEIKKSIELENEFVDNFNSYSCKTSKETKE